MPHSLCNDPNCTCNSPDLKRQTNQILKRDAAKTDYIVIPLIAGVIARCVLAEDSAGVPETGADLVTHAREVMELAARAERGGESGGSWEPDGDAYGIIKDLVFCNWPVPLGWCSHSYGRTTLGVGLNVRSAVITGAALRWLSAVPAPSLTESVIIATYASTHGPFKEYELPLLSRWGRKFRVAMADRLRRDQLSTWPKVLVAAVNDWTVPTLERIALHHAAAGDRVLGDVIDVAEARDAEFDRRVEELATTAEAMAEEIVRTVGIPRSVEDDSERGAAESLLDDMFSEVDRYHGERDRLQRERDQSVDRLSRARSRIDSLEQELESGRIARAQLATDLVVLRRERDMLAERFAAEEAVVVAVSSMPADIFAARRVLLFTGVEAADARAALAQGFWDLGAAQVDIYWTDKSRGPDTFPSDAIIATDVTYMGHSDSGTIKDRARAANAWYYEGRHGAATMARATAAAWRAHRAHTAT